MYLASSNILTTISIIVVISFFKLLNFILELLHLEQSFIFKALQRGIMDAEIT